jgi:hypothetical protein
LRWMDGQEIIIHFGNCVCSYTSATAFVSVLYIYILNLV